MEESTLCNFGCYIMVTESWIPTDEQIFEARLYGQEPPYDDLASSRAVGKLYTKALMEWLNGNCTELGHNRHSTDWRKRKNCRQCMQQLKREVECHTLM